MLTGSPETGAKPSRADVACVAGLLLLVLLLFFPVAFLGEGFYFRDLTFNHLARKTVATDALLEGVPPLWNPYLNMGEPLLANPNNATVHPSNLLFLVLPFFTAFNWAVLLELMLAGVSLYLLQRRWNVRPLAAFVAASGYLLSGHLLSLGNFWNALAAAAPAPLALLAADIAARSRSNLGPLFLGAVWAVQASGGEPVVGLLTAALSSAYLLWMADGDSAAGRLRHGLPALGKAALWAVTLAAIQILPALELVQETTRVEGLSAAEGGAWSVHPATLLETVVPGLYGNPTLDPPGYWGGDYQHRGTPYMLALGIGKVTMLLGLLGALMPARRNRLLAVAATVAFVFALGSNTPLFPLAFEHVPFFSLFRFPVKFFFVTNLCLSALCGLGLERLLQGGSWSRNTRIAGGVLGAVVALAFVAAVLVPDPPRAGATLRPLLTSGACLVATAGIAFLLDRRRTPAVMLLGLLALLQGVELYGAHAVLNPSAPRRLLDVETDLVRALREDDGLFRIHRRPPPPRLQLPTEMLETPLGRNILERRMLTPNFGIYYGLSYALNRTSDALESPATSMLGSYAESLPPAGRSRIHGLANIRYVIDFDPSDRDDLESVVRVQLAGGLVQHLRRNPASLPRAYVVGETRRVDGLRDVCLALGEASFDPRTTAIVSDADPAPGGAGPEATVRIGDYAADRVRLDVETAAPGTLVLLDAFAPGWRATLDGAPVEIRRTNAVFRGVPVPAGSHRVEFVYRPLSVTLGATLTGLALLAATGLLVVRRFAGRQLRTSNAESR